MKFRVKFRADDLHFIYCRYFGTNLQCFDEVFLIALTSMEQLFLERPLYRRTIISYPINYSLLDNNYLPYFQ